MTETVPEMVARIAALKKKTEAEQLARQRGMDQSRFGRLQQDIGVSGRFLRQVASSLNWLWLAALAPALHILARWGLGPLMRGYVRLWNRITMRPDVYGTPVFRKTRGGIMVAATAGLVWFMLLPLLGAAVDGVMYAATAQVNEKIYLLGSQELNSDSGTHAVEGCKELPCSNQDAIYLRARYSFFNEMWSIIHGHGLFYPELIASSVPNEVSTCLVTTYGIRQRLLVRQLNLYPDLLAVTCTPLDEEEKKAGRRKSGQHAS